jgi:RND family efflux transporter MFP subunit
MTTKHLGLAALAIVGLCGCGTKSLEEVETKAAVPVTVEAARIDVLRSTLSAAGTVMPAPGADQVILPPEHARIAEVTKAEGDAVREGEVLVRFDIPTLPADLAAKRAAVDTAKAHLDAAKANLTRELGLFDQHVVAARDVEEARKTQTEAEAELAQANSAVEASVVLADRAIVHARFSGVVVKRWHSPGDIVDPATSDPILRVINPAQLQVVAAVPVADLSRIVSGHAADVHSTSGDSVEAARVVTRPAQVDPASATADVRLTFVKPTHLAAGATVQVDIVGDEHPKALVIPAAAIVRDEGETFVMVAANNKAHKYPVVIGLSTHDLVEIASGDLKAGDLVIVRGQEDLPEGAAITIQK